jgi:hypothetical protein
MVLGPKAWESRPLPGLRRAEIPLYDVPLFERRASPKRRPPFAFGAGWSSPVARQAHNLKVAGSNPAPATNLFNGLGFGLTHFVF